MRKLTTTFGAGVGALALAATSASPAMARDDRNGGIGTTEVIAGAVVLAGIVALLASDNDDDDRYDRRYDSRYDRAGYRNGGQGRAAIEQCVYATERQAGRYGYADVTQIRAVEPRKHGYRVKGIVEVQDRNRGRGWGNRNRGNEGYATFNCRYDRGRVVDVEVGRLRG